MKVDYPPNRVSGKFGADRLAHHRTRTVAADQKAALDAVHPAAVEVAQGEADALHRHVFDRGAVDDGDALLRGRMFEQDRLEEDLVDACAARASASWSSAGIGRGEAVAAAGNS